MSAAASAPARPSSLVPLGSWTQRIVLGSLVIVTLLASWYLLPFWRESPELSHGFFAPICAVALLWQSRREPDLTAGWSGSVTRAAQVAILLAGLFVTWITALAALAQGPFHSQTAFLTGMVVALFFVSGTLTLGGGSSPLVRCNGASLGAALLWCFVVPLPAGTLARFTLFLQDHITAASLQALHLFGFAAERNGNIIKLANTLVGVEEACSGIRSLTACLFAGVVLGGLMLSGIWRRVFMIVAAGAIAVVANLIRSITLCLLAANEVEIRGLWHDATAYAVLGVTALVLFGGCLLLSPKTPSPDADASPSPRAGRRPRTPIVPHALLAAFALALAGLVAAKVAPAPAEERPPPDLGEILVMDMPDWIRRTDESIFAFSNALNTSYLHQESYYRGDTQLTFYLAYWPTNQSTLGSVALHTPDICLPGGGWETLPAPQPLEHYPLATPRRFSFQKGNYPQHVWFWHFFDGQAVADSGGVYPWQLGPLLLKRKVSAKAPQWVVRVSSNRPMETLLNEPILEAFFRRLKAAGLTSEPTS